MKDISYVIGLTDKGNKLFMCFSKNKTLMSGTLIENQSLSPILKTTKFP